MLLTEQFVLLLNAQIGPLCSPWQFLLSFVLPTEFYLSFFVSSRIICSVLTLGLICRADQKGQRPCVCICGRGRNRFPY